MGLKAITEVQQIFTNAVMSGTTSTSSIISNIKYKDSVAVQYNWIGNPTGTFTIQGSLDYNPGLPQTQGLSGGPANGSWNAITLTPSPATSSGSATYLVNMNQLAFPYIQTIYTNSTGSGVLNAYIFAKSLG